jgi:hypothetical protein
VRTPSPLRAFLLGLLSSASLLVGCGEGKATLLFVNLFAKDSVKRTTALEVSFTNEGERKLNVFSKAGQRIDFPTSFVIQANGRSGEVEVSVKAMDETDSVVGEGGAKGTLAPDSQVDLTLLLYPSDFQVNARYAADQIFADVTRFGFGRQLASSADGSFVAVWEDKCPHNRCDVYFRTFDPLAAPKTNPTEGSTDEVIANEPGNDIYDMPTVAVQADSGSFVMAWQRTVATADPKISYFKVMSRSFAADGRPDAGANGGKETELSGDETQNGWWTGVPHIALLRDRGYLVVWEGWNAATGTWEVKGRYLGPNGVPTKTYDDKDAAFSITSFAGSLDPEAAPAVAAGPNSGFMVVWNENGAAKGLAYGPRAAPLGKSPVTLDSTRSGKVEGVNIAGLLWGYGVVWTDTVVSGADQDGSCIRLRRLNPSGEPMQPDEVEFTLSTTATGNQKLPALAALPDGSALAVWSTEYAATSSGGHISGRKLLPNLLPVGDDFQVNTTQTGYQEQPSVAPHALDGFVVIFVDHSGTPPDTLGTGIRGRLVYPDHGPADGKIGAVCDSMPCDPSLSCQSTEAGQRCVARCTGSGAVCPHGGVCRPANESSELVCLYSK